MVRNELIFYFILFHVPRGRRRLTYSRAVHLPGVDLPLSSLLHLFSPYPCYTFLSWLTFPPGGGSREIRRGECKSHLLCNSLAISSSSEGLAGAFVERLLGNEGRRSLPSFLLELWGPCAAAAALSMRSLILHRSQETVCNSCSFLPVQESR